MKILYVSPNGHMGGAERFVVEAAGAHHKRGLHEVKILFLDKGQAVEWALKEGIPCDFLPRHFRLRDPYQLFRSLLTFRRYLKNYAPDILHLTMPYSVLTFGIASLGLPLKRVWFQHGPVGGLLDHLASFIPVDALLFNSKNTQDLHFQQANFTFPRHHKILHLPLREVSVPAQNVQARRSQLMPDQQKILIGMVGRICDWKGMHLFISAISELKKNIPPHLFKQIKFVIIGSAHNKNEKEYEKKLHQWQKDLALEKHLEFLPSTNHVFEYYQAMDILIHASTIPEPFGLVVAEAMLQKTLVIGSNLGGVNEILKNHQTGLQFSPLSRHAAEDLAKILGPLVREWLKSGENPHSKLVERAYHLIQEQYNATKVIEDLESFYSQI